MSLAARCPHCKTVFRISSEQLSAAQGWVRCGGCSAAFDATAHLATPKGEPLELPTVQPEPAATAARPPFQAMPDIDLELPDLGALPAPEAAPAPAPAPTPVPVSSPAATVAPYQPTPAFGPGVLAVLGLLLSLCALLAYAARGPLVHHWPALRPVVLQLCASLGCELPAVRDLRALTVQGSSLSQDSSTGHHRLRVQLRNASDGPVFMPALDVSIVDAQDEVLARRMFDAGELQPALSSVAPGAEATVSVVLDLRALQPEGVASFRLSTFYP
jgi:predicted Zn finger-like uncharacterized protein